MTGVQTCALPIWPAGRQQNAVVPEHQPQTVAANVEIPAGTHAAGSRRAKLSDSTAAGEPSHFTPGPEPDRHHPEQAIARGILCAGSPDTVYRQIMDIYEKVGGFGHFIFIGRSGFLDHREAEKGIRLLAREVLPRLPAATPTPAAEPARAAE